MKRMLVRGSPYREGEPAPGTKRAQALFQGADWKREVMDAEVDAHGIEGGVRERERLCIGDFELNPGMQPRTPKPRLPTRCTRSRGMDVAVACRPRKPPWAR